jgi:hypothetical protein
MGVAYPGYRSTPTVGNITIGGASASSPNYASMSINAGTGSTWASTTTAIGKLKVKGKEADIFINGQSLSDWMSAVEQRLSILRPRPELQEKYSALQEAYEHYKTLERLLYEQE